MSFIEIFILAVALAIDASLASLSQGTVLSVNKRRNSVILAFSMAMFQALMPFIGWFIARSFYVYLKEVDHWLAFAIFFILGVKFIMDSFKKEEEEKLVNCISLYCILSLSLATSIDALVAGATLSFLNISIIFPAIIIGVITFIGSLAGFWSGYFLKQFNKQFLEIFGGLLLIGLGFKVLIDHLFIA